MAAGGGQGQVPGGDQGEGGGGGRDLVTILYSKKS